MTSSILATALLASSLVSPTAAVSAPAHAAVPAVQQTVSSAPAAKKPSWKSCASKFTGSAARGVGGRVLCLGNERRFKILLQGGTNPRTGTVSTPRSGYYRATQDEGLSKIMLGLSPKSLRSSSWVSVRPGEWVCFEGTFGVRNQGRALSVGVRSNTACVQAPYAGPSLGSW